MLQASGINKCFGPTIALSDVSLELKRGSVRGLIGENGSGKSTLASIIAGVQAPDDGAMVFEGKAYAPKNAIEAVSRGVCMIVQEMGTFSAVTVTGNLFIGREKEFSSGGIMNSAAMRRAARKALDRIGATHIDERGYALHLSMEDRKLVEIARAMDTDPRILIVDETTTALSKQGRDILYALIEKMRDDGKSVLFISHDIAEVMEICDRITVLRDGVHVRDFAKEEFSEESIKASLVGRKLVGSYYRSDMTASSGEETLLRFDDVSGDWLHSVSLDVKAGEIVGVGGLTDSGMHSLGKMGFGLIRPDTGRVIFGGDKEIRNPLSAMKCGVGYISKDRDWESLMTASSIRDNICYPSLRRLRTGGLISGRKTKRFATENARRLNIKYDSIDQYVMYLSGGNKQKVALAKWIGFDATLLILDCPTRGIDIGVKQSIYGLMSELKAQGRSILMISEELPELLGMCDRIYILKKGRIEGEFMRNAQLGENELIDRMI